MGKTGVGYYGVDNKVPGVFSVLGPQVGSNIVVPLVGVCNLAEGLDFNFEVWDPLLVSHAKRNEGGNGSNVNSCWPRA